MRPARNRTEGTERRAGAGGLLLRDGLPAAGLLVLAWALAAPLAWGLNGWAGLAASTAAAAACLAAAGLAWLACAACAAAGVPAAGVLAGTAVRMAASLGAAVFVFLQRRHLAESGFVYYLLGFYLVGLAAETWMLVRWTAAGVESPG